MARVYLFHQSFKADNHDCRVRAYSRRLSKLARSESALSVGAFGFVPRGPSGYKKSRDKSSLGRKANKIIKAPVPSGP